MLLEAVGSTSGSGSATTLSYSYTSNRRSTFAYDINGNVTNDATNSLQTSYYLLNFPAQTKSGTTVKAYYSYLSDGTKASVLNASGAGYDYNGTFTYSHASGGTRALESVAFGTRQQNGLTTLSANRWRFSGKEGYDGAFGIALDDFGARRYDRTAWTSIDPLAEKYYSLSPYAYCAGNPVKFVDPEGKEGVRYIDENGRKTIESNIVVLQRPLETIPSDLSERAARRIQRRNARLQEENAIEISNIQKSLDDIYNGDKGGSYNSDGELVYFKFNVVGVYTDDIDGNNTAFNNSVINNNGIPVNRFNTMSLAKPAIIAKGSTEGHFGIHKAGSVICVRQDAPYATLAHEVGHSFHLKDSDKKIGLMSIFPTYLLPEEVDTIWNEAYPK